MLQILEQTKNFKLKESLEKILLISILSSLPNNTQISKNKNYTLESPKPITYNHNSQKTPITNIPNLYFQTLRYDISNFESKYNQKYKNKTYRI